MPNPSGTYIAFDFGTKKMGVAVGQMLTKTATPLPILRANNGQPDWSIIEKHIQEWKPKGFVVGMPLKMDDKEQPVTIMAKEFANQLEQRFNLPIYFCDERLTTKAVKEHVFEQGGYKALKKTAIDSLVAKMILEDWFRLSNIPEILVDI